MAQGDTIWTIQLSEESLAVLSGAGINNVPNSIVMTLKEASMRERTWFAAAQATANTEQGFADFITELIRRRAPADLPREVIREAVQDIPLSELAELPIAFLEGKRGDPKNFHGAMNQTLFGPVRAMLTALAQNGLSLS